MEQQFEQLVEQAPDGVVILEAGAIVFINETASRLLGVDRIAALGRPIASLLPPADARAAGERIARMLATGQQTPPNEYNVLADPDRVVEIKSMRWHWQGRPAVLAFARDVTERKALQKHLVHADRLAAVGTLAAGVAHEINNPLTYVQLSLQLIEAAIERIPDAHEALSENLREAAHGVERIASITRTLRMFARPDEAPPGPIDPVAAVERALKMVDTDLRHRATLVREIGEVPWVIANVSRLEQVLVNLLINAIHSLEGRDGDSLTVQVAAVDKEVVIRVRDTGRGIPADILDRVFDPFFTTKSFGQGIGLGLSVSRSIVEATGGRLAINSKVGVGTTATVTLRAHHAPTQVIEVIEPIEANGPRLRVLLVDDEPLVRELLAELLGDHHEVTMVEDGEAAVAATSSEPFDAILCDVMMPGLTGVDVYERVAQTRPGLEKQIVFMSGGTFVPELATFVAATGNHVLAKPFPLAQALAAIRAVKQA